jgi:hypothetical protein
MSRKQKSPWSFADEVRRVLKEDHAPALLQSIKDDRSGKKSLSETQRRAARVLLRKVMTEAELHAALASVQPAKRKRR